MKKIVSVLLCMVFIGSVGIFAGCNDATAAAEKQALQDRIDALNTENQTLQNRIDELEQQAGNGTLAQEVQALQATVSTMQSTLGTLNETITVLSQALNNAETGNTALKSQIDALTLQLDTLTNRITEAETRISLLEAIHSGENAIKTYIVGSDENTNTFTFVNNGIKLFSIQALSFGLETAGYGTYLDIVVTNYAMPTTLQTINYIGALAVNEPENITYLASETLAGKCDINKTAPAKFFFRESTIPVPIDNITCFYIGIPTQTPSVGTIIPYAKFLFQQPNA